MYVIYPKESRSVNGNATKARETNKPQLQQLLLNTTHIPALTTPLINTTAFFIQPLPPIIENQDFIQPMQPRVSLMSHHSLCCCCTKYLQPLPQSLQTPKLSLGFSCTLEYKWKQTVPHSSYLILQQQKRTFK